MHRFYIHPEDVTGKKINIGPDQARHAYSVLRLRKEASVAAFDGEGNEYLGILMSLSAKKGTMYIREIRSAEADNIQITLAAALPRFSKFESIVDKATQLGVGTIIPIVTERTVVKLGKEKSYKKVERWQKIAVEAAKQCGCAFVPKVEQVIDFAKLIKKVSAHDLILIPSLQKGTVSLKKAAKGRKPKRPIIFIGPEGDFTQEEVSYVNKHGAIGITLGENVLRCETAVTMVLSVLNYEWKT